MKKLLLVSILCMITILSACSTGSNKNGETEVTAWTPPASTANTKVPNYNGINVQEEQVKVDSNKTTTKATQKATEETESTEATETESIPTQGVPNPAGRPVVTTAMGSFELADTDFIIDKYIIPLNSNIEDIFAQIGEDNVSQEISDTEMAYQYEGYTMYTYIDKKDVEKLYKVVVTGKNLSTAKGVKIGDYASQLVRKYGNPHKQESGIKYYINKKNQLVFKYEDNLITEISYVYVIK